MSFIGDIIGGVIGAVTSGVIAIYISQKGIKQERKERYVEKLQDRKDMWLNEHYKELYNEFKNFSDFIIPHRAIEDMQALDGYSNTLATDLVSYHFQSNSFEIKPKRELNDIDKGGTYKSVFSHLKYGYANIYNNIDGLYKAENDYKNLLSNTLNELTKITMELMKHSFPDKAPFEDENNDYKVYDLENLLNTLVYSIISNTENNNKLLFDGYRTISPDADIISFYLKLPNVEYNKFKDNVWNILNNEFKEKIKTLNGNKERLSGKEEELKGSIKNIIDDYDSGHAIQGYCNICKKIYLETDITKLRPKI